MFCEPHLILLMYHHILNLTILYYIVLGMNMLTSDFFTYGQQMGSNDSDHNPERAGWVMIINAHW